MADIIPKDRRGQILLLLTAFALASIYFVYAGTPVGGIKGITQLNQRRDSLKRQIDSLKTQVRQANLIVRRGTGAQLQRALAEYRANLDMMRTLVPASEEIPNLFDDVTSRAKVRGTTVVNFVPQPLESGTPFDTKRARATVTGAYDQIGEFLADIASLPRIVVPYDIEIRRITSPTADSALRARQLLQANFTIRTYVKGAAPPPGAAAPQPAARGTAAPGARPAAPAGAARGPH